MNYKIATILVILIVFVLIKQKTSSNKYYKCIRAKRHKDFKCISQCAYEVYGKSYPYKYVYNPQEIEFMNKQNILSSFVIKDKRKVIGHVALNHKENSENICEMSTAFVSPKYRGKGLLNKLSKAALNSSKKYGFKVAYVEAVCTHMYSQKEAKKLGMNECAIMINKVKPISFKELNEDKAKRETLVRCYLYLTKPLGKQFYVAKKYRNIVKDIYESLGVEIDFYDNLEKRKIYRLKSILDVEISEGGNATINILKSGRDIYEVVINKINELVKTEIKSIIITIKLNEEDGIYTYEKLQNSGFIFCGVEPGYFDEDLIMFQYVFENVDFKSIHLASNEGKKILKYIENEYYKNNERKEANEI